MAKDDWWFKFQYSKWDDPELVLCDLETQGFWLRVYIHLRKQGLATIKATVEDLAKVVRGTEAEVRRSILDLRKHKAADVTLRNAQNVTSNTVVTLTSRSLVKELSGKEKTKLRVRRHRENVAVTPNVTAHSKSNKKEVREEEEKNTERVRVSEPPDQEIFLGTLEAGLTKRMGIKSLPNRRDWHQKLTWAFVNQFSATDVLDCYDLMKSQNWRTGTISAKTLIENLPNLLKLRAEVGGASNGNGGPKPQWQIDRENCGKCDESGYIEIDGQINICNHNDSQK